MALRVEETSTADVFLVSGRGELHLSILVETMRREGAELEVSRPLVITKQIDGKLCEPVEQLVIDTTEGNVGSLTEELAARLAQMMNLQNDGSGNVRLEYRIPTRGLIGFRNRFLTLTRGEGQMATLLLGFEPGAGPLNPGRPATARWSPPSPAPPCPTAWRTPRTAADLHRATDRGLRGHDRRHQQPRRGHPGQRLQREEADQHSLLDLRHRRAANPAGPDEPGGVARLPGGRRAAGGHPEGFRLRKRILGATERARAAKRAAGR